MADEVKTPEEMSLAELKAAALAQDNKEVLDNSADAPVEEVKAAPEPVVEPEEAVEEFIVRREIDLGDGSGVQVFIGKGATKDEAYEDYADKLAEAQRHATEKIRELRTQLKAHEAKDTQASADEDYVIKQRLDKEPKKALRDVVDEVLRERQLAEQNSIAAQERFVAAHEDYVANPDNGARLTSEVRRLGFNEFSDESLEKAYQSLKASGLLSLKAPEADVPATTEAAEPERIVPPVAEVPQVRSPRRSSTVPTRGSRPVVVATEPTEDDLYAMPLDKLRKLSNEQLSRQS